MFKRRKVLYDVAHHLENISNDDIDKATRDSRTARRRKVMDDWAKQAIERFGALVESRRGDEGLRECAARIGTSPATLSRVERGQSCDLKTFLKICWWLGGFTDELLK